MAIILVLITLILGLIAACNLFLQGYKKQAILLKQGIYSFAVIYSLLVIVIGLWG